jgi:hypothetical protein
MECKTNLIKIFNFLLKLVEKANVENSGELDKQKPKNVQNETLTVLEAKRRLEG